jgi:hypothetical protein
MPSSMRWLLVGAPARSRLPSTMTDDMLSSAYDPATPASGGAETSDTHATNMNEREPRR